MKNKLTLGSLGLILCGLLVACPPPAPPPSGAKLTVQNTNTVNGFQVAINTQATFYATVEDTADQSVTWGIDDPTPAKGSINDKGEYKAPATVPSPDKVRIRATSKANTSVSGYLEITIVVQGGIAGAITIPGGLLSAPGNAQAQASSSGTATQAFAPDWSAPHVKGQVLLVSDSVNAVRVQSTSATLQNARVENVGSGLLRVTVPAGQNDEAFAAKLAVETGAKVQPNYIYKTLGLPNDPRFNDQSYLTQIDVQGAWSVQTGLSADNLIAVLDTGAKFNHPDLDGRLNNGTDFCPKINAQGSCQGQDNDSTDISTDRPSGGHGTHASGIIAAKTNNGVGIAGISQSGKILVVKVFANSIESGLTGEDFTNADSVALSNGIKYAADAGAKVISLSLGIEFAKKGSGGFDTVVKAQIDYAVAKGALLVAAAGNVDTTSNAPDFRVFFPASEDNVLAVGAVDGNNKRTYYSAYQGKTDLIFAPGGLPGNDAKGNPQGILSTYGNDYGYLAGTSFAAPQVSAVAGLMFSQKPALTRVQVTQFLRETAKQIPDVGGLLQAGAALRKAQNPAAAAVSTTIYVYADPLKAGCAPNTSTSNNACYDGNSPKAGRSVVTFTSKEGAVNYSVTINRSGQSLEAGTYRVVACVNKNSNNVACDSGDLFGISPTNIVYDGGTTKPGNDVTLAPVN